MRNDELVIAVRLWIGRHIVGCGLCGGGMVGGCRARQAADGLMIELGATETSPLGVRDDAAFDDPLCSCRVCVPGIDLSTVTTRDVLEHVQRHRDGSCHCAVCLDARG